MFKKQKKSLRNHSEASKCSFTFVFKQFIFSMSLISLGDNSRTQKLDTELRGDHSQMWKVKEADHAEIGECNI